MQPSPVTAGVKDENMKDGFTRIKLRRRYRPFATMCVCLVAAAAAQVDMLSVGSSLHHRRHKNRPSAQSADN
jgi:hypothetical protein